MQRRFTGMAAALALALATDAFAQQTPPLTTRPAVTGVTTLSTPLTGAEEVPGPGDADGSGRALLILNPARGTVCYVLGIEMIAPPTAAHIHEGAAGVAGPPVVPLDISTRLNGCATGVDRAVIDRIRSNPAGFYVNVHNADHPPGAIRGQLEP